MSDSDLKLAYLLQKQFEHEEQSSSKADLQMAKLLQEQFNHEQNVERPINSLVYDTKKSRHETSKCLTDPSWELVDPTPNVHNLFIAFNEKYFWNKLLAVCVSWSKRMTTCAGICSYQGRAGLCKITLSEPLLKLRPRKDLVETLLHEMIHAYLFVTHNNRDRDGHGPEFHKHMDRINNEAGTKITVYHSFHDEVRLYQQHWWKCNGPCQTWKPYYGMVRRAMNRAPGPSDHWWGEHSRNCGGTYIKVKEPEKVEKPKGKEKENVKPTNPKNDIRQYISTTKSIKSPSPPKKPSNTNNIHGFGSFSPVKSSSKQFNDNAKTKNIHGFHDINTIRKPTGGSTTMNAGTLVINKKPSTITKEMDSNSTSQTQPSTFTGQGNKLSTNFPSTSKNYEAVRNHWLNKFDDNKSRKRNLHDEAIHDNPKKSKEDLCVEVIYVNCPICSDKVNDKELNEHVDKCLEQPPATETCVVCDLVVLQKDYPPHLKKCLEKEEFFDDEDFEKSIDLGGNSKEVEEPELQECEICNELFNAKTLKEHKVNCLQNISISIGNESFDSKECDMCHTKVSENIFDVHLESCILKMLGDMEDRMNMIACLVCNKQIAKSKLNEHLEGCMSNNVFKDKTDEDEFFDNSLIEEYESKNNEPITREFNDVDTDDDDVQIIEEDKETYVIDSNSDSSVIEDDNSIRVRSRRDALIKCPICQTEMAEGLINTHLDECIL